MGIQQRFCFFSFLINYNHLYASKSSLKDGPVDYPTFLYASYRDFYTFADNLLPEEMDVEDLFEKLNLEKDTNATLPTCLSSVFHCSANTLI